MGYFPFSEPSGSITIPVPIADGGTGKTTAAAAYNALSPMTTKGDMEYDSANGTAARLAVGTAGQSLQVSGGVPAWGPGQTLLATTGSSGYTMVNGTGSIISWTAPNDGAMHRATVFGETYVTSGQTGGQISLSFTAPNGNSMSFSINSGSLGTGGHTLSGFSVLVQANTTVSVSQTSALTGGAAVLYAELWGS